MLNLKQVLERWLGRVHTRLRRLPRLSEGYTPPSRQGSFYRSRAAEAASLDSRTRRLARYEVVKKLYEAGRSLSAIARGTSLNRKTVCKCPCGSLPRALEQALVQCYQSVSRLP